MSANPHKSWAVRRYKGVTKILGQVQEKVSQVGWAVGATTVLIIYPLAISILDHRFLKKNGVI